MPQNPQQQGHILLETQLVIILPGAASLQKTVLMPNDNFGPRIISGSRKILQECCFCFLTFQVKHFPVGCQNHSQIIIGDTAPGFVF